MKHHIYVVSTEWGGSKGGINIFNKSLVEALPLVVRSDVEVHAVVQSADSLPANIGSARRFESYDGSAESLAKVIDANLSANSSQPQSVSIIGHDVHTGPAAIGAAKKLKEKYLNVKSAVFCHMDYAAYQRYKGAALSDIQDKVRKQRSIVGDSDIVYAVGPLLKRSFENLRTDDHANTAIYEVIPGFPEAFRDPTLVNPSQAMKFFFSGRITEEDDRVKNGRLVIQALYKSYTKNKNSLDSRWQQRGEFVAFGFPGGVPEKVYDWFYEGIDRAALGRYINVDLLEFAEQDTMFEQLRDSHAAFMPSIHEGFGLAGWEAVCAGVPLICSDQSGLAVFLDSCFQADQLLPGESILTLKLGDSESDVEALADKIEELVATYERRRRHARDLAQYLAENFKWEDSARTVASALNLAQMSSPRWERRKKGGDIALSRQKEGRTTLDRETRRAIELAESGKAFSEWGVMCIALNVLSDIGKAPTYAQILVARSQLEKIASGIEKSYESSLASDPRIRVSGRFDVAWRFMAAASNVAISLKGFVELIPDRMMQEVIDDSFLRRELLFYSMKYSDEFTGASERFAQDFFKEILSNAVSDPLMQTRFARLEAVHPNLAKVAKIDVGATSSYSRERDRCVAVKESKFDLSDLLSDAGGLGPTALALATGDGVMTRRGIDQLLDVLSEHNAEVHQPQWRGDRLLRSALLSAAIHPRQLLILLSSLAVDEEEALRWSAVDLAFSRNVRMRLYEASRTRKIEQSVSQINQFLGEVVDQALATGEFHPWIQREFLNRFQREHEGSNAFPVEERLCASDFPLGRQLFGPPFGHEGRWLFERLHPEVEVAARTLGELQRRVLLVLPPILANGDSPPGSETSTPPLGLGMIGSQLLAHGHDVYLADCHRSPETTDLVVEASPDFDWVGFNVVLPTVRSVFDLSCRIKRKVSGVSIVVGGPAVNARAFRNAAANDEERSSWDFEIWGDSEENFVSLVADSKVPRVHLPFGVTPNERSDKVARAGHALVANNSAASDFLSRWPERTLLDRRLFSTIRGEYEPHRTRAIDSSIVEAHVVMSRGCEWNCSFCTERKEQSGGEQRRDIGSVELELEELAKRYSNLRVQFVDDNVLPQIATLPEADLVGRARAIVWSTGLLSTLTKIRANHSGNFGWRGIFRVEDFFSYEKGVESFVRRLAESGCRMLAFGVEHGNEKKRSKMKAGTSATNGEFRDLFNRLRRHGIHSKAYFIIGGPKETRQSSDETIEFAINSGVSLAYFAIYKEFVPALRSLRSESLKGDLSHSKYSTYGQLRIGWDEILERALKAPQDEEFVRFFASIDPEGATLSSTDLVSTYDRLSRLGFRFSDIVKYSDLHAPESASAEILSRVNFGDQAVFEATVAAAYLRFYARGEFVSTYEDLVMNGY